MKQAPTPMQQRVLDRLQHRGEDQSLADVARDLGITSPTLGGHLVALARKGHIVYQRRGPGRSPTVRLPGVQSLEEAVAELERRGWWIEGPRSGVGDPYTWRVLRHPTPAEVFDEEASSHKPAQPRVIATGFTWRGAVDEAMGEPA